MTPSSKRNNPKRPPAGVVVGVLVAVLGVGIWWLSQNIAGVTRGEPPVPTVNLLPPPPPAPPPPPPPPEKPPDPDKIEPPKPSDQPKADEPKQLTIAGPAQAGGNSFGIKAGSGGGSSVIGGPSDGGPTGGGGFADAAYSRFLGTELQRAVQSDSHLNSHVFNADVAVWVDAQGHLTRAKIYRSSGDASLDQRLVDAIEGIRSLGDSPPPTLRFPQHVVVRSRRG